MLGLELIVLLGIAILIAGAVARRTGVAEPVPLLVCGLLLGFVPALRGAHLPPEAVLLIFLPALLFWESLTSSLREIRANLRPIVLASSGLVLVTAASAAWVTHALGVPWGPAWVLGAALAPTDATAVAALTRALPRRTVTLLRTESLINDGTALVLYSLAVGVSIGTDDLNWGHISGLFALSYLGGAAAGILVAVIAVQLRRRLDDPLQENVAFLLTPFTAFLLADVAHASGVLAVVACGLTMSQLGPRAGRADSRRQSTAFWSLATFMLNGGLFVLVGIEAQSAIRNLTSVALTRALVLVAVISVTVIGARFAWMFTTPYIIRALDRRPQQRARRASARARVVSASAGFRGAVSLAAALAVPQTVSSGAPFPDRDLIVFVTAGVIMVTLAQALALPHVVRWAGLPNDTVVQDERHFAERVAAQEAFEALPQLAADLDTHPKVLERMQREYEKHLRLLQADHDDVPDEAAQRHDRDYTALRLATVAHKRATVLRLRDQQEIDDTVLRQLQSRLDIEEIRLSRPDHAE